MKVKVIEINELNNLYEEYKDFSYANETFKKFVERTKDNGVKIIKEVDKKDLREVEEGEYIIDKLLDDLKKELKKEIELSESANGGAIFVDETLKDIDKVFKEFVGVRK